MKVDMSAEAVTRRLRQTSELRKLCLALAGKPLMTNTQNKTEALKDLNRLKQNERDKA